MHDPPTVSFSELENHVLVAQEAPPLVAPTSPSDLDQALTAQIVVAWAGEGECRVRLL
jgi:hypothetical protein